MARTQKLDYVIICDDIREEISRKISYIGVYNEIHVTKIPYVFPKLCFSLIFSGIKANDKIIIDLKDPSGENTVKPFKIPVPEEIKGYVKFTCFAIFSPLEIKKDGEYHLTIQINNNKKVIQHPFIVKCPNKKIDKD